MTSCISHGLSVRGEAHQHSKEPGKNHETDTRPVAFILIALIVLIVLLSRCWYDCLPFARCAPGG